MGVKKKSRRWLKYGLTTVGVLALCCVVAVFVGLSCAQIEATDSGVITDLRIPLGKKVAIKLRTFAGTGEHVFIKGYLAGPVVRRHPDGTWSAKWFCQDHVEKAQGHGATLTIACAGKRHVFNLHKSPVPSAVAAMPEQLVVLSDIEGNVGFLDAALRKLGVVDAAGHWQYGKGQLVVLGDSVDRGRDVFAVLWQLHDLGIEAQAAGGAVHVLLGNHEQYMLRANASRGHPEYRYALQQLDGYQGSYAADTVLGVWLRAQPVALKLGKVLFVHGGISPQVADAGLSVADLNRTMRAYWPMAAKEVPHTPARDAVLGFGGVTQYRGYFRESEDNYSKATQKDVQHVLAHFNADTVVVAHTLVEGIERLYDGRVYAVDVNHAKARPEVLVFRHGVPEVVDIGIHRGRPELSIRPYRGFSLFNAKDRAMLKAMHETGHRMSSMPWPY